MRGKVDCGELRHRCDRHGLRPMKAWLQEGFTKKLFKPDDFSIRELAETLVDDGREWVEGMGPGKSSQFFEAGAVQTGVFTSITGQIFYNSVLEGFTLPEFVISQLIPVQTGAEINGERIAGVSQIGDQAEVVDESMPYPMVGVSEDWIDSPATQKQGLICGVTREAVYADKTGQLMQRCRDVGYALGLTYEKAAIDCVIDENTTRHRYRWRNTSFATFQATTPWINTQTNALVDWTDIDNANQLFNAILDPMTGEPVLLKPDTLICTQQLEMTAKRIRNATEITVVTPGFATTGNPTETRVANPMQGAFEVVTSPLVAARLATDTSWFYGDPRKAFVFMECWPLSVEQAPTTSEDNFKRDIVSQYRADRRGAYFVREPRRMNRNVA